MKHCKITDIPLIGVAASGKGTLGRVLAAFKKGVVHVEMSAILDWVSLTQPDHIPQEELLKRDRGDLFSDQCVTSCLSLYLHHHGLLGKTLIYDGAGRTANQVVDLNVLIESRRTDATVVVLDLRIDLATALRRGEKRRKAAIAAGKEPRKDDTPEIIEARFDLSEKERPAILEQYRMFAEVIPIDASRTARETLLIVADALDWKIFGQESGIIDLDLP